MILCIRKCNIMPHLWRKSCFIVSHLLCFSMSYLVHMWTMGLIGLRIVLHVAALFLFDQSVSRVLLLCPSCVPRAHTKPQQENGVMSGQSLTDHAIWLADLVWPLWQINWHITWIQDFGVLLLMYTYNSFILFYTFVFYLFYFIFHFIPEFHSYCKCMCCL